MPFLPAPAPPPTTPSGAGSIGWIPVEKYSDYSGRKYGPSYCFRQAGLESDLNSIISGGLIDVSGWRKYPFSPHLLEVSASGYLDISSGIITGKHIVPAGNPEQLGVPLIAWVDHPSGALSSLPITPSGTGSTYQIVRAWFIPHANLLESQSVGLVRSDGTVIAPTGHASTVADTTVDYRVDTSLGTLSRSQVLSGVYNNDPSVRTYVQLIKTSE